MLVERSGRWLICTSNVDNYIDEKVQKLLEEVSSIAQPEMGNGWVVVTSRCGQLFLWDGMHKKRNVVLEPFPAKDAMYVHWCYKKIASDSQHFGRSDF